MQFRKSLLALAGAFVCAISAAPLSAQVGVYVMGSGNRLSSVPYTEPSTANPSVTVTKTDGEIRTVGGVAGGYYDFLSLGRVRFGVDLKGKTSSSNKSAPGDSTAPDGRIYELYGGGRFSLQTHVGSVKLVPYVEGAAGLVRSNYGLYVPDAPTAQGSTGRHSNLGVGGFVGADLQIAPVLDFRVEAGSGIVHGSAVSNTLPLQSISAGIVFHSPRHR